MEGQKKGGGGRKSLLERPNLLRYAKGNNRGSMYTATADEDKHGAAPTYRKPLGPGARRPLGARARAHERPAGGRDGSRAPRTSLNTIHTQSSACTWDRESKTLMDTHNRTVQQAQSA